MGFMALEDDDWRQKIFIQAVGANYSDPKVLGSDCLISNGVPVCLNDFKVEYEDDPNKTIHELALRMEQEMRDQITDVRNMDMAPFHEDIIRVTCKGLDDIFTDFFIPFLGRWM